MPLHLLGKKSWNVYNPENIARVQRDEAAAKALDDKNERDQRTAQSSARLQALRGEEPVGTVSETIEERHELRSGQPNRDAARRKRRLAGEDDTDRDIRLARIATEARPDKPQHFGGTASSAVAQPHSNAQSHHDAKSKSERDEDAIGMRFKDAMGYRSDGKPWYNHGLSHHGLTFEAGRAIWGNEDSRRHEREQQRLVANDPLQAMKRGVKQLKEHEKQRQEWREQRERDLYEVERLARERSRTLQRRNSDEDSLEGFSLEGPTARTASKRHRNRDRDRKDRNEHHRHRRRSRSPERRHRSDRRHRSEPSTRLRDSVSNR